jgi:hypothetical protein
MGVWRAEPLHDYSSHCADAAGTGVQGATDPQDQVPSYFKPVTLERTRTMSRASGNSAGWMR